MWKDIPHRKPRFPVRRERYDLHLRMQRNQSNKLRTRIAACAKNDNPMCHCKILYSTWDMERMLAFFKPPLRRT
jgi:hypothetical protein